MLLSSSDENPSTEREKNLREEGGVCPTTPHSIARHHSTVDDASHLLLRQTVIETSVRVV